MTIETIRATPLCPIISIEPNHEKVYDFDAGTCTFAVTTKRCSQCGRCARRRCGI
jgi:hypothetical protein